MSRKTLEVVYDSLTQKEVKDGVVTVVRLSIGDDTYSLDLIPASHEKLMSALAPFIEHEDKITHQLVNAMLALPDTVGVRLKGAA